MVGPDYPERVHLDEETAIEVIGDDLAIHTRDGSGFLTSAVILNREQQDILREYLAEVDVAFFEHQVKAQGGD